MTLVSCQRYYDVIASLQSNPEASNQAWIASSFLLLMTNRPSVILNEVKNRIETKGKPTQRFFTSFRMTFFSCHFRLFDAIFGVSQ